MRVAAIDVGTNSIHLLVAEIAPDGRIGVVETDREQVMLGSGGLDSGVLTPEAIQRGLAALERFHRTCQTFGVVDVVAAATSAVREARNGSDFVHLVRERTGIHIRVISGTDEARLVWLGARNSVNFSGGKVLLMDLGGGSTEFILCDHESAQVTVSIPLGHIRLAEAQRGRKFDEKALEVMKDVVDFKLRPLMSRVHANDFVTLVGTSGTARCLARMATLSRPGMAPPSNSQGLVLKKSELEGFIRTFSTRPSDEWEKIPGFDLKRKDTLAGGAVLIRQVMKRLRKTRLITAESGLREGLIVDWMVHHRPELALSATVTDPRHHTALSVVGRYGADEGHARQVSRLAMDLFDLTAPVHRLGADDRRHLEFAAWLHDIGHHISGEDHNKHGAYLIRHTRMHGFDRDEIERIAMLVRYHRGSKPKSGHPEYEILTPADKRRLKILSALLQVADSLDRSHNQPVQSLTAIPEGGGIKLLVLAAPGSEMEHWSVERKLPLLTAALECPVRVDWTIAQDAI